MAHDHRITGWPLELACPENHIGTFGIARIMNLACVRIASEPLILKIIGQPGSTRVREQPVDRDDRQASNIYLVARMQARNSKGISLPTTSNTYS